MNQQGSNDCRYETWDDAFRGLLPRNRQQSVRVASYTRVLYVQACSSAFMKRSAEWPGRVQEKYIELAYKCGLYHMLGKSLLPSELQLWRADFTDNESKQYQSYTTYGRRLVAYLQEKNARKKTKDAQSAQFNLYAEEKATDNLTWALVREAAGQHMERYDGSGFPNGLRGDEISPIAQIIGLAKELDLLATTIRSEEPFDEAFAAILAMEGAAFSPKLMEVCKACRGKLREVFRKYIQYSNTIQKTVPLVDKRDGRPLGMNYSPLADTLWEAVPFFRGNLETPETEDTLEYLEPMLVRTDTLEEVIFYLLYETADTLLRIKNSGLSVEGILFTIPESFYVGESKLGKFEQLFRDQPIDASRLMVGVPASALVTGGKAVYELLAQYTGSGIQLVLDGYDPQVLGFDRVREVGFTRIRFSEEADREAVTATEELLSSLGIATIPTYPSGQRLTEQELVQRLLERE